MFKRILLPTDGSELSLHGVRQGIDLAGFCGASVFALHVIPPFYAISHLAQMIATTQAIYLEGAVKRAHHYLARVRDLAAEAGVPCDSGQIVGDPPSEWIVHEAQRRQCDVIVMASHGRRGFDKLMLGSETQKVLQTSPVPVLVCH